MSEKTTIPWTEATWNPLPDFPGYFVSQSGKILSMVRKEPKILRPIERISGHLYVFLYRDRKMHKMYVHRAVLLTFCGGPSVQQETRHLDGNPKNNHVSNLAWGTSFENSQDRIRHGRSPCGERSVTHKLTEVDVLQIRREIHSSTLRKLAKKYGISHTAVRRAALGRTWGYLHEH